MRRGGLPTFKPMGLAPQKVVETDEGDPTRDTYQRKVFYDSVNFFVVYWDLSTLKIKYVTSTDGEAWSSSTDLLTISSGLYYGGNVDIVYPNHGTKDVNGASADLAIHYVSGGDLAFWRPYVISGASLVLKVGRAQGGLQLAQGGSVLSNLNGSIDYAIFHQNHVVTLGIGIHGSSSIGLMDSDQSVPYGGTTTGGAQLLPYKTSSPFNMFALAKGSDNKLYYNIVIDPTGKFQDGFSEIATLGTSFSDFCACSEAQAAGDPERVHLVYIKSTGELCYNKFENDELGVEKVLVASGASYPVIAVGSGGKLYISYVKDGKIWVIHYRGAWFKPVELFTADHTYNNPAYLSSNQNVQSGKICLVWTEGTATPYEVWFCILED